jgi:hypothetical protein
MLAIKPASEMIGNLRLDLAKMLIGRRRILHHKETFTLLEIFPQPSQLPIVQLLNIHK